MSDNKKRIQIDNDHPLFNKEGLFFKEFPSDFRQIRYFTLMVVQNAPPEIKEINLLEQQISEIIKNAVKHGNHNDTNKKVKIWYEFTESSAHIIVEDEGPGFQKLKEWNDFNEKRLSCYARHDFEELGNYVSYRTEDSDDHDGGNALFAAIEYWNEGVVFTQKANCIALKKTFPTRNRSIKIS
ncbi:ATP-binding protein [Spirochaeta cellobiosiphila]|uniref:ATP-binding protein n=1 Tax=Spirochaeta cellobiosiphila TaxID=504483 RepID=UPI000427EC14|nr:ATP-binding protein [Spirochaeta cellobiosiphila]